MRIAPPLIITDSELIEALNTIVEVLNTIEV
jgi:4-aminobutyrate aminotransferase-like enzyme